MTRRSLSSRHSGEDETKLVKDASGPHWRSVNLLEPAHRHHWITEAQALWNTSDTPYFAQHPGRLHQDHGQVVVMEQRRGGTLTNYVIFEPVRRNVTLRVGNTQVARSQVMQAGVVGGIVGSLGENAEVWSTITASLPGELSKLPIWLNSVPLSSLKISALQDSGLRRKYRVFRFGRHQRHFASELAPSFQEYLAKLPTRYRRELLRITRKLEKEVGTTRLQEYSRIDEVGIFLDHAVPISAKTYQTTAFKVGLAEHRRERQEQYRALAAKNAWFAYVLFCGDQPVAFKVGCQLGRVFYGLETGYLPEWGQHSVGRVAMTKLIDALLARDVPPTRFDLGYGDQNWKRVFASEVWEEGSYVLVPHWCRTLPFILAAVASERFTEAVAAALARWGLKERVRGIIRGRGGSKHTGAGSDSPDR